nr:hypothetical protein [Streptomyces sp. SID12501]
MVSWTVVVREEFAVPKSVLLVKSTGRVVLLSYRELHTSGACFSDLLYRGVQEGSAAALSLEFRQYGECQEACVVLPGAEHGQCVPAQHSIAFEQEEVAAMSVEQLPENEMRVAVGLAESLMVEPIKVGKILFSRGAELILPAVWHT